MIDREHALPLTRQATLLKLSRGSLYYQARPVPPADLAIMRRIDELHLDYPFAGSRMLRDLLRGEGVAIGRPAGRDDDEAHGDRGALPPPEHLKADSGPQDLPVPLRSITVERANQVWAMDITYIPMARGFVYLAAVVDWFSRRVLAWRLSITMEVAFCLDAVEEALAKHGRPEIFNTDPSAACWPRLFQRSDDWPAGQSWQPIHQRRLHRPPSGAGHCHQHGRQGSMAGQRFRRAALALGQVRGGLSPSLRKRPRGPRFDRPLSGLLQPQAPAFEP
jgi:putative transposase